MISEQMIFEEKIQSDIIDLIKNYPISKLIEERNWGKQRKEIIKSERSFFVHGVAHYIQTSYFSQIESLSDVGEFEKIAKGVDSWLKQSKWDDVLIEKIEYMVDFNNL